MSAGIALSHLVAAVLAGALIGAERTYHGRAAGMRTYALVCLGSALLLVMMSLPAAWLTEGSRSMYTVDPTRVVQGILTGIGFLGAGVIVRERFSVRGLTTAASIWTTAGIGILIGSGYVVPGLVATALTLIVLTGFKSLEERIVAQHRIRCVIAFERASAYDEDTVHALFRAHHFRVTDMSYEQDETSGLFRYDAVMWAHGKKSCSRLTQTLRGTPAIVAFSVAPTRD